MANQCPHREIVAFTEGERQWVRSGWRCKWCHQEFTPKEPTPEPPHKEKV